MSRNTQHDSMRHWNPQPSLSRWIGLLLLVVVLGGATALARMLVREFAGAPEEWQVNLTLYGQVVGFLALLGLAGVLAYRVAGAFTLGYDLDRNGLYISWLGNRAVVPLDQIYSVDV